jgi:hypothetical protein
MSDADDVEFEPEGPENKVDASLKNNETNFYASSDHSTPPNSFHFNFGRWGHISWHSESSAAVLSLLMFFLLCATTLIVAIVVSFSSDKAWASSFLQVLGHAITAVVGAVVGAGASSVTRRRK